MIYDYLIVGAGIGGLSAGLNLKDSKKKVLILEKNSLPGGMVSTFKRGRFEFDTSLYELYNYGTEEKPGILQEVLKKMEIDLDVSSIPFNIWLKDDKSKLNFKFQGEAEELILELEKLKNGSIDALKQFIEITKEIKEAVKRICLEEEASEEDFPHFYKYLNANVYEALKDLKMPKEIINIWGYLWIEIGSPLNKLSFIDFALYMNKIIFKKQYVLNNKALDFTLKLVNAYQKKGGKIYFNSEVEDIKKDNNCYIVTTKDKLEYKTKNIICNESQRYVFKNLIKTENKMINKLENARTLGANAVVVYLGLNRSAEEIGLKNYKYYHFQNINSEDCVEKMHTLNHSTYEAIVPNIVNEKASPKNTTEVILIKTFYGDSFKNINADTYPQLKMDLAANLIKNFEDDFNIDIEEYIEEMEIATPLTFIRHTNSSNGSIFGYMPKGYDNSIHRIITVADEKIPHLDFVGAYSYFGSGVDNAFLSGYYETNKLLAKEVKHDK